VYIGMPHSSTRAFAMLGRKHVLVCFAAGGLCGTGFSGYAVAGPPLSVARSLLPTIDSVRFSSAALLHRVHREGVPIIRLWNSKSALLSIGLNQKGKLGLWLIQKIP
jgi:hypothetical protein